MIIIVLIMIIIVLAVYVPWNKAWLLMIFKRKENFSPSSSVFVHICQKRFWAPFSEICAYSNTHIVMLPKRCLTKWEFMAVVIWMANESDILLMAAVMLSPLSPWALQKVCFLPRAADIIQPDGTRVSFWGALRHTFSIPMQQIHIHFGQRACNTSALERK